MIPLCLSFAAGGVASTEPTAALILIALALWRQRRRHRRQEAIAKRLENRPATASEAKRVRAAERANKPARDTASTRSKTRPGATASGHSGRRDAGSTAVRLL
jgi:hypothetical protein